MGELTTDSPWEMWSEPFAPTGELSCRIAMDFFSEL